MSNEIMSPNVVEHMSDINNYKNTLTSLSKSLQKTVLTGKISSLDVAETLFTFMEETQKEFASLQEELVKHLVTENIRKLSFSVQSRAQVVVEILVRNLFERTADVGFLATDDDLIDFLNNPDNSQENIQFIKERLHEYVLKYSVYDEIILLRPDGEVVINLDDTNTIVKSKDKIIQEVLETNDDFCELFRYSDLQPRKEKSLIYVAKIKDVNKTIGILCLCFKIDDEMKMIFDKLDLFDMKLALLSHSGEVLSNNKKSMQTQENLSHYTNDTHSTNTNLSYIAKSEGYQGYTGQNWHGFASSEYQKSFNNAKKIENLNISFSELEKTNIISKELKNIRMRSEEIIDDLADVVINGEIIASKRKVYSLNPILDNIRVVSESIHNTIKKSIEYIYNIVIQASLNNTAFKASLCVDIMDRNLYERANDCRWWALNTTFRKMLNDKELLDTKKITSILEYINSLYTVYTNIFIYDKERNIIAVSNSSQNIFIGKKVNGEAFAKSLSNIDSQLYYVTPFEKTELYDNKPTYIYCASITSLDENNNIGGIGIVFDSEPEFKAIMDETIDAKIQMSMFCSDDGIVLSTSTICDFKIGEVFEPIKELEITNEKNHTKIINIKNQKYLMGAAKSNHYREYKNNDGYTNTVYCVILSKI
ncbi:cache domain-containing protein [Sulfurospirillum arcachonense]|uniref:cache domain-containing protein n=1 Tax=Sulfurospirillum arcachonense TaxID=57666 RepID=UPI000469A1EA|nr:cache domain-containing protein [Sulfurospirillum arcachonense]